MTAQKKLAPAIIGTLAAGAVVPLSAAGASAHTDAPSSGAGPQHLSSSQFSTPQLAGTSLSGASNCAFLLQNRRPAPMTV
ncbi:hypothetical protein [Nesterenkonia sp. NBAIMH1]|uniref:hypothetical protein n=1 Tax=Nesterenkonia sp. NBAIMH1 TaxID=2600320 RepID=UPI0011B609E4|nr:hypothetical protein [Nesterenkonia sp. NBAIMH1]